MKVSVSNLEQYRRYCSGLIEYDDLINGLAFGFVSTPEMEIGTQIHEFIENGCIPPNFFTKDHIYVDLSRLGEFTINSPYCEVPIQWESKCGVTVSGRVDSISPIRGTIYDHKVTESNKGYLDSLQWRLYLTMTELNTFVYNVFLRGEVFQERECSVYDFYEEHYTAYNGMKDECEDAVRDYKQYIYQPVYELKQQILSQRQRNLSQRRKLKSCMDIIEATIFSDNIIYPYEGKDMFNLLKDVGFEKDQVQEKKEAFKDLLDMFKKVGVFWDGKQFNKGVMG